MYLRQELVITSALTNSVVVITRYRLLAYVMRVSVMLKMAGFERLQIRMLVAVWGVRQKTDRPF